MDTLLQDLHYCFRSLIKSPGFTFMVALALALGIGGSTAVFSLVNDVLLHPLPYADADRLVVPVLTRPARDIERGKVAYLDYMAWKRERVFEQVAVFFQRSFDLTSGGEPDQVEGAAVSEDYFAVLKVEPFLGRSFLSEEQQPGPTSALVISYGLWQRRFGSDANIIGQKIEVNGRQIPVVGVMPKDAIWPETLDVLYPTGIGATPPDSQLRPDNFVWEAIARLKTDRSLAQSQAEVEPLAQLAEQQYPQFRIDWSARLIPIREWVVGPHLKLSLLLLFGSVVFVLIIACVSIANLLLARLTTREREIAIRIALGASRLRIARQLFTESVLLGLFGGFAGVLLALWGVKILASFIPNDIPMRRGVNVDFNLLGFGLLITLLTIITFGLIPALFAARVDPTQSLKEGAQGLSGSIRARRVRSALVTVEVALSFVLLICAGLMVRSFLRLQLESPGFQLDNIITMRLSLPPTRYSDAKQVAAGYEKILDRISALPGIESSCASSTLPLGRGGYYLRRVFLIEGVPEPPAAPDSPGHWNVVTTDYFTTMGIPVLRGRPFGKEDTQDSPPVIIISETMARRHPFKVRLGFRFQCRLLPLFEREGAVLQTGRRENPRAEREQEADQT